MGGATIGLAGAESDAALPWLRSYPPGVSWDMRFTAETLPEMFDAAVARFGSKTCMDFMGRRWSFAEMGALANNAAAGFRRLGVTCGTRVGLCLPNSPFFVAAFYGALKAGAIVVNYSPLYVEEELAGQMADSGTEVMVTVDLDPLLPRVLSLLDKSGSPLKHVVACQFSSALPMAKGLAFRVLHRRSIAAMPRGDASHSATTALDNGRASPKSDSKRAALARRDKAAEAGQVLEYSTAKAIDRLTRPSRKSASTSIG